MSIRTMTLASIMTALVIVFTLLGKFIPLGANNVSLALVPIVIGAATGGTAISTWLGFVFGLMVLATDAAAFLAISVPGTVITVLLKGTACGFVSGVVYNLTKKKSEYLAVYMSAIVCPIVNTGIFLLGCVIFFFDTIKGWGVGAGYGSTVEYMFLGLAGGNFIFELITNLLLSPTVVFLTKMKNQIFKR